MFLEKRWELVHYLLRFTQEKKINWELGPADSMYYANIGGSGVGIRIAGNDFLVSLFNEDGEIVEMISDDDFQQSGYSNAYNVLSALHELAKAEATGSEKIVDSLLTALKSL